MKFTKPKVIVKTVKPDNTRYTEERAAEFAARLRAMRERQGLKQSDLAARSGLSPAAVSQLETGERRPNFATLVSLAKALGSTPDALLGLSGEQTKEPELKALFRKLEGMSKDDVSAVQGFISYLRQKKGEE